MRVQGLGCVPRVAKKGPEFKPLKDGILQIREPPHNEALIFRSPSSLPLAKEDIWGLRV